MKKKERTSYDSIAIITVKSATKLWLCCVGSLDSRLRSSCLLYRLKKRQLIGFFFL